MGALRVSRRLRLLIGAIVALGIVTVLVAPVVLVGDGASNGKHCLFTLRFDGRTYTARTVSSGRVVERVAIGVGLARGCGAAPANVNVRSIAHLPPAVAVGVGADASSIYVRSGLCSQSSASTLMTCLAGSR
jgi:hypothetical protein